MATTNSIYGSHPNNPQPGQHKFDNNRNAQFEEYNKSSPESVTIKRQSDRIKELEAMVEEQHGEIASLRYYLDRFTSDMSTKVAKDERYLENVSMKSRPMNISQQYQQICTNEWHEAKTVLDSSRFNLRHQDQEEMKLMFLSEVFKISETDANFIANKALKQVDALLNEPVETVMLDRHAVGTTLLSSGQHLTIPDSLRTSISDMLRLGADKANLTKLEKTIIEAMREKCKNNYEPLLSCFETKEMKTFISSCANLAWNMVLQRPKMIFVFPKVKDKINMKLEEPFWGSTDPKEDGACIYACVYPRLYHKEILMVKGKVILKKY